MPGKLQRESGAQHPASGRGFEGGVHGAVTELSGWDVAYSAAYAEEQEKRGLFGLSAEETPPEMDKETHKAVIEQVGERPDPGD